jgi:hypothetical protein
VNPSVGNFKEPPANFGQFLSGHAAVLVKFHGIVRHDRLPFHACARFARGRFSICHRCATKHSVLNFSVSVVAAENSRIPALHSDTGASGTGSSNPSPSSGESGALDAAVLFGGPGTMSRGVPALVST